MEMERKSIFPPVIQYLKTHCQKTSNSHLAQCRYTEGKHNVTGEQTHCFRNKYKKCLKHLKFFVQLTIYFNLNNKQIHYLQRRFSVAQSGNISNILLILVLLDPTHWQALQNLPYIILHKNNIQMYVLVLHPLLCDQRYMEVCVVKEKWPFGWRGIFVSFVQEFKQSCSNIHRNSHDDALRNT